MWSYVKKSYQKFIKDALSKALYDAIKWIVILIIGLIISGLLPVKLFKDIFLNSITLSVYQATLISLLLILISIILVSIFFRRRYLKFKDQNQIDELTGLKNHKALKDYIEERLEYYNKNGGALSIILIDIDDFKSFNTKYGYNTSDQILGKVGSLLGRDKRASDETFRKFSRGDEFLIVANETSLSGAIQAAERKRKLIENNSFLVGEIPYKLTVSCGVTELKINDDDYIALTDRVSRALSEAKEMKGKNCTKSNF